MPKTRFLQIADVHIGSSMESSLLDLPDDKRDLRKRELKKTLRVMRDKAFENEVDFVLIVGDLFDSDAVSHDDANFAIDIVNSLAPIEVFITPGNHDPYTTLSAYSSGANQTLSRSQWGENVTLFTSLKFQTVPLKKNPQILITGQAYVANDNMSYHTKNNIPEPDGGEMNILMLHGGLNEPFYEEDNEKYYAFDPEEVLNLDYDYIALGHYHSYKEYRVDNHIRAINAGAPFARGLDEVDQKYFIIIDVEKEGKSSAVNIQKIPSDTRKILKVTADLTGTTNREAILSKIEQALIVKGLRPEDILYLKLTGRVDPAIRAEQMDFSPVLAGKCFHLKVDKSELKSFHDIDAYLKETTDTDSLEYVFVKDVHTRYENEQDPEKKRILMDALQYGLDVFKYGEVIIPDENY